MVIRDTEVTLEYLDINKTSLLTESFKIGGAGSWTERWKEPGPTTQASFNT